MNKITKEKKKKKERFKEQKRKVPEIQNTICNLESKNQIPCNFLLLDILSLIPSSHFFVYLIYIKDWQTTQQLSLVLLCPLFQLSSLLCDTNIRED